MLLADDKVGKVNSLVYDGATSEDVSEFGVRDAVAGGDGVTRRNKSGTASRNVGLQLNNLKFDYRLGI